MKSEKILDFILNIQEYTKSKYIYKYGNTAENYKYMINKIQEIANSVSTGEEHEIYMFIHSTDMYDDKGNKIFYVIDERLALNIELLRTLIFEHKGDIFRKYNSFKEEMIHDYIYSEVECSLKIEGIHSTRKEIELLSVKKIEDITDENEIIVKNMIEAYMFMKVNEVSKDNFYKLYQIMSSRCLKPEEELKEGNYYRHDEVFISDGINVIDEGVHYKKIEELMDGMFSYINNCDYESSLIGEKAIICQYYVLYIHPYFDYNGRMARALSFWIQLQNKDDIITPFSESVNKGGNKDGYYNAIRRTRENNNNVTFFANYMIEEKIIDVIVKLNLENVKNIITANGENLSRNQELMLKIILRFRYPNNTQNYFNYQRVLESMDEVYSKQYILKELKVLEDLNILETKRNKSNTKVFKLNYDELGLFRYNK